MLVKSLHERGVDVDTEAGDSDQRFRKLGKATMYSANPRRDILRVKHPLMRFFGMPMKHGKYRGMTIDPLHGAARVKRQMIRTSRPIYLGHFMIRRNFIQDLNVEPYVSRFLSCLRARDLMYKHKSYYPALWRLAGLDRQTGHQLPPETNLLSILKEECPQERGGSLCSGALVPHLPPQPDVHGQQPRPDPNRVHLQSRSSTFRYVGRDHAGS